MIVLPIWPKIDWSSHERVKELGWREPRQALEDWTHIYGKIRNCFVATFPRLDISGFLWNPIEHVMPMVQRRALNGLRWSSFHFPKHSSLVVYVKICVSTYVTLIINLLIYCPSLYPFIIFLIYFPIVLIYTYVIVLIEYTEIKFSFISLYIRAKDSRP